MRARGHLRRERRYAACRAQPAAEALHDRERGARVLDDFLEVRPWRQFRGRGVLPACWRADQRGGLALAETERERRERQLRRSSKTVLKLPRHGVGRDLPCRRHDHPAVRDPRDDIEREQRPIGMFGRFAERVRIGCRDEDGPDGFLP